MKRVKREKNCKLSIAIGKNIEGELYKKENIGRLLMEAADERKDSGITFIQNDGVEDFLSYESLLNRAVHCLGGLQKKGIQQGQHVMLVLEDSRDFIISFWACILGGIIPVPLVYPTSLKVKNSILDKLFAVWNLLKKPVILSDDHVMNHHEKIESLLAVKGMEFLSISTLYSANEGGEINLAPSDTPAFIQFSSGSTSVPKGVILTHRNLLTNIEAMIAGIRLNHEDKSFSWMPYHHDMGLIGFHLVPTAKGIHQFNMSPMKFVKRPNLWLDYITKYRITLTGSPNFGYRLLLSRAKEEQLKKWDLRSLRLIFNGAEPISVSLMREFMSKLKQCHLRKEVMFPVYGMAEACLAVSFPKWNDEPSVNCINRKTLVSESRVEKCLDTDRQAMLLVEEGSPVAGMKIRIVDEVGNIVPEGIVGEVQIYGENVTDGYIYNDRVTKESIQDGWLKTGDTGFLLNDRLTIVGRIKDIIFVNGQNFYAHDIEGIIEKIEGVKPGRIAICGWHDEKEEKDKVALFSSLPIKQKDKNKIYSKIVSRVNELIGIPIDYVVLTPSIPKTTSGKVQRFVLIDAFKNNKYEGKVLSRTDLSVGVQDENIVEKQEKKEKQKTMEFGKYAEKIREIWSKVLEIPLEHTPYNESFLSLGGTSIKAIQILGYLEDELSLTLSHDILINCRTVNEMDEYIVKVVQGNEGIESGKVKVFSRKMSEEYEDDIAVIALSCRFPDASTPEAFWENLVQGKCSIQEIPSDRWSVKDYYNQIPQFGKTYCRKGAFIQNPYAFDASLFNISEEEAAIMDPQQRMILELTYELVERAGYTTQLVDGEKVGLFIGAGMNSYYEYHLSTLNRQNLQTFDSFKVLPKVQQEAIMNEWKKKFGIMAAHPNILVDNILNMIAARTSQEFNFKGPSMVVDTACSSSLVTLHMAYESLKRGECEVAIAGGINLLLTPAPYIFFSHAGALSSSGRSMVFDEQADGFVPGEGAGLVMLKTLKKAKADGDKVLATIKASTINNDGRSIGVMAPNPDGQREVIESLYVENEISPKTIQYVEAHGTGTRVGDPSEVRAIDTAFRKWNVDQQSIAIGSVKANIGHLLGAAGIGSFIKVIMSLLHRKMPPNINIFTPNPMIKLEQTPFYLLDEPKEWSKEKGVPRRAAINSFGFGGTNCHLIVEEASETKEVKVNQAIELPKHALCLSAHSESALQQKVTNLIACLEDSYEYSLGDVCYTENVTRTPLKHRYSVIASSIDDLIEKLKNSSLDNTMVQASPKVALMFTGQGSQYAGMARQLYKLVPRFKKYVDDCSEAFYPILNQSIVDLLYVEANESLLAQTHITQPVVFTIDYALGKLLLDLGVKPACMLGHSVGEWVAACLSEMITLQDAARLVAIRGELMNKIQTTGAMTAIFSSIATIEPLLEPFKDSLWFAGYNITHQVISGQAEAMEKFLSLLEKKGIVFKKLKVSQAFHTPLMEPMLAPFKKELNAITFNKPKIPIVSNVTAEYISQPIHPEYWLEHILGTVKFEQSMKYVLDKGINIFVEAGPDKVLTSMANGLVSYKDKCLISMIERKKENWDVYVNAVSKLYTLGVNIDWKTFMKDYGNEQVILPSYPFEHKIFKPDFGEELRFMDWLYEWKWEMETPLYIESDKRVSILVFDDEQQVGKEVCGILEQINTSVYVVTSGNEFHYDGDTRFTIRPESIEDYMMMLQHIQGDSISIIHLWNSTKESITPTLFLQDESALFQTSYSIILMAKALKIKAYKNVEFIVVTDRAFAVLQDEEIQKPQQSISAVIGQVIDQENGEFSSRILDVDNKAYENKFAELAELIVRELSTGRQEEAIVAIRDGKRFVRKLERIVTSKKQEITIQDNETYVITGGTGHIGGEIARAFLKKAKVNLVLTGREQLPSREEWKKGNLSSKVVSKINVIQDLENQGAKVEYFAVDVTNEQKMKEMIQAVKQLYGPIHGVVHAAGTIHHSAGKLLSKDLNDIQQVMSSKVQGTIIADMVTRQEPLKFFVTLSSISASKKIWAANLGDYAAGNAFLNGYSQYRKNTGAPGRSLSINYSLWADKGLSEMFGDLSALAVKAQKLNPLSSEGGTQAFFEVLQYEGKSVVHILDRQEDCVANNVAEKVVVLSPANEPAHPVRYKTAKEIKEIVYQVIAAEINCDAESLEVTKNFLELSIDSLKATKVIAEIGKQLNTELYPTLLFEYQTPEALAEYIEKTYAVNRQEKVEVRQKEKIGKDEELVKDIAIIGMSVRIPGANNLEEYWKILQEGECMIQEVPEDRWRKEYHYSSDQGILHKTYSKHGGFIERPYDFDPLFFGMSPKEAEATDPQQRIFMQVAWEALQQAGYGGKHRTNQIGVFVGCEQNTYMEHFIGYRYYMMMKDVLEKDTAFAHLPLSDRQNLLKQMVRILEPGKLVADAIAGNGLNEVAARVSHCLNLTGPSMIVNTACSSSLVALHHACQSIRQGETNMAIAGGVNLNLSPTPFVSLSRVTALSSNGNCYPFDARANGMVLSEGAGAVLLKSLEQAMEDGDHIFAVIKGSAINNDGRSQGITAPRPQGQAEVIQSAYLNANVHPETVSYIETHGTATPLGDPIEVEGMTRAFRTFTDKEGFCGIGSVKSSIGHMLSAAGIVSLVKVALAMKHKMIPHTVNYDTPNPNLDFQHSPFYVVAKQSQIWGDEKQNHPLRAGVNAFGFGGTNAHVILEEAPILQRKVNHSVPEMKRPSLLLLTGRTEKVIQNVAMRLKEHMKKNPDLCVPEVCYSMNSSQKELSCKVATVIKSKEHLYSVLEAIEMGRERSEVIKGRSNPNKRMTTHFLFDGTLCLDKAHIKQLNDTFFIFHAAYKKCLDVFETEENENSTSYRQIQSFSCQYAIGKLLLHSGIQPKSFVCEGIGILVGAACTGIITVEAAIQFIKGNKNLTSEILQNRNDTEYEYTIITPMGIIHKEHTDILKSLCMTDMQYTITTKDVAEYVEKNDVVIQCGMSKSDLQGRLISMDIDKVSDSVHELLLCMAKLYTLGVNYNSVAFFEGNENRIPLPTYPFENKMYKVTFEDENIYKEALSNRELHQKSNLVERDVHKLVPLHLDETVQESEKSKNMKQLNHDLVRLFGNIIQ
ncbi:SDR family NAD(P)-dependent oxidoreductase [Bacillus cytotoxicus]